jgi:hypothetical protein
MSFGAVGHYGKFVYALSAVAEKLLDAIGHCLEFCVGYGSLRQIWLFALGHSMEMKPQLILLQFPDHSTGSSHGHNPGFGYELLNIAQDLVMRYRPQYQTTHWTKLHGKSNFLLYLYFNPILYPTGHINLIEIQSFFKVIFLLNIN